MYPGHHTAQQPDKVALQIEDTARLLTFKQLDEAANQVAHLLRHQGLQPGDHIAVLSENRLEMLVVESAAERSGLYYTLINTHLSGDEVTYILSDCRARVFFASVALLDTASVAADASPTLERRFIFGADQPPSPWEPFSEVAQRYQTAPIPDQRRGQVMLYSSGTTGRPKGIWRPVADVPPEDAGEVLDWVRDLLGFREGMTYLNPAPLYHSAPQGSVSGALRFGGTVILMEHFDAERWCQLVQTHQVTHCQMVPTMFIRLLRLPEDIRRSYDLSSLEVVVHGAAPCPIDVKRQMIDWLGPIITEYYGATEGHGFTICDSHQWLQRPGTVGREIIGVVEILDDDQQPVPAGTDGTIWFRSDANYSYFNDPDKTSESRIVDTKGMAATVGDIGHLDSDGYLYLTDRKSHTIISGGVNIYPQETENLLASHPAVADVAVIGVPNSEFGEEVKAVIVLVDPDRAGPEMEATLIAHTRAQLAHFKCPRSIDFVAELPRAPTGKLYKRRLRDQYWPSGSALPT